MAEYIKREDALKWIIIHGGDSCIECNDCEYKNTDKACSDCLYADVNKIPAADVVEVVRCKDCKYWGSTLAPEDLTRAKTEADNDLVCDMWMSDGFTPNDYCSHGERAENGRNDLDEYPVCFNMI